MGLNAYGNKGNYLFITFNDEMDVNEIVKKLREKKIYVKGPWKDQWSKSITITIGPEILMKKFVENLKLILGR